MNEEDKDKIAKEKEIKIGETQSEGDKQPLDESKTISLQRLRKALQSFTNWFSGGNFDIKYSTL